MSFEPARDVLVQPGGNNFNLLVDVVIGDVGAEGPLPLFDSRFFLSVDDQRSGDDIDVSLRLVSESKP